MMVFCLVKVVLKFNNLADSFIGALLDARVNCKSAGKQI